jgi:Bardet-Biedl syndrome 2 protein
VKAEDARLVGNISYMKKMYANIKVENASIQSELLKKQQNNDTLMEGLKEINSMINMASNLRVGNAKSQITTLCRNAVKKNNLFSLIKLIQTGKE